MKGTLITLIAVLALATALAQDRYYEVRNDCFRYTTEGKPMYTQGGGIFRFADPDTGEMTYYWYGCHYKEAELYREDPRRKYSRCTFVSVSCYSSKDMLNWHEEADVLTENDVNDRGWLGRLGVGYLKSIRKYVLMIQHNSSVMMCTSDSPKGPFKQYRHLDMTSRCGTPSSGDQTLFIDPETQTPYLVYSNAHGRNRTYISEIGIDEKTDSITLLTCQEVYKGASREGNCMFKHNGRYYLYASNIFGWDCSYAYYLMSDNIYGPYLPNNEMLVTKGCEADFAHVTQTGFFANMQGKDGKELVMYYGDRWADFANNGLGYNQVFPMSFDEDGSPVFNSMSAWEVNPVTLDWHVSTNNNYVRNGSFEADRRLIPEPVKPRQDELTGWTTTIVKGSPIGNDHDNGIKLNRNNLEEEQRNVVGKMSLCVTDNVDFVREISQTIASEQFIPLPDGRYRLQFKIRNGSKLKKATVSIESGGKTFTQKLSTAPHDWQSESLTAEIRNGKATLTFHIEGKAKAECSIDDIELTEHHILTFLPK